MPATPEQAHALLFDEILTLEETRAAAFVPQALVPSAVEGLLGRAESLLRALAVIDDGIGRGDDPDQPPDPALLRLEAKLDLLTLLVADLAGGQAAQDAQRALRWSARGVELVLDQARHPARRASSACAPRTGCPPRWYCPRRWWPPRPTRPARAPGWPSGQARPRSRRRWNGTCSASIDVTSRNVGAGPRHACDVMQALFSRDVVR